MKLVIVESPSKSKTITKYLGDGFTVRASVGHVRDLPKSSSKAIDIEGGFIPHYEIVAKKEEVLADISAQAKKADEIILASDPDREGEAIAWHIAELLTKGIESSEIKNPKLEILNKHKVQISKIKRITFHEITKEAIEEALKHPRSIDINLKEAQEARRVLDRLVGYDLSGIIWKKVRYGLSAGRVQSPALRILVEREREIEAFKSETFWVIEGDWKTMTGAPLKLTCSKEPRDKKEVDSIISKARAEKWQVIDVEESEVKRSPRAPFITSTLQQAASSRLGFSPSRTMGIAQKLYESGAITYMRTDSTNLGQQALDQIGVVVKKQYGEKYLSFRKYATKSKNAQEAHEAIRPSHFDKLSAGHTDEQKKLYRLIWQRAVASQMADANIMRTKIIANTEKDTVPNFEATGSRILFDGWLKADPDSNGEEVTLPKCAKDQPLELVSIDSIEKQTLPPPRYTEAGLIKELEKRGIGRPSTYASICKTIEDRGYVGKEGRSLKPTDTGMVVSSFLEENFPTYISDTFTAEMEDKLDGIANGTHKYVATLKDFYGPFHKEVKSKEKVAKATNLGAADPKFICPKCGTTPMEIKLGRNGKFLSCTRYPDCDGALTLDGHEFKKDEPIGVDPTTGLPIFVLNGRFGPYVQLGLKIPKEKKKRVKKVKAPKKEKVAGKNNNGKKKTAANAGENVAAEGQTPSADTKSDQNLVTLQNENNPINPPIASSSAAKITPTEAIPTPVKPKMASIPRGTDPATVTVKDALKYLSLPRNLGIDPKTGKDVVASAGRFGPYVVSDGNYRSIKAPDNVYDIDLKRALEMLAIEKKPRGFTKKNK